MVQSRQENTPKTRQWHYTNRKERKRKARLEKLTNTTEQVKAREGVNIEDTCGDNLWSIQEIQKKVRDKDLCYKKGFPYPVGSHWIPTNPQSSCKNKNAGKRQLNLTPSSQPAAFFLFFPSSCPTVGGPQHNEFWQLKTTPETGSPQDISDSCLRATSFKGRCFPSGLPTTQAPLASTELMLWSFVLSVQLCSLSRG